MRPVLSTLYEYLYRDLLVWASACFIGGGILARIADLPEQSLHLLLYSILLLYTLAFLLHRRPVGLLLLYISFILTGLVHIGYALLPPSEPDHLYNLLSRRTKVTLTGKILNMPEFNGRTTRFELAADTLLFQPDRAINAGPRTVRGRIRLSLKSPPPPSLVPGNRILVAATAGRTYNSRTPGVFDYRMHMADRSVYVTGRINSPVEILPFTDTGDSASADFPSISEHIRQQIGVFLDKNLAPEKAGLYKALLIGSRAGVSEKILEQFKASGCMHLLAISGLHMGLLGLMTVVALTWLMKRSTFLLLHTHVPTMATLLSLFPLVCYAFIAGLNTPVLRALIMSVFFLIGIVLQRQRSILHITAAAALVMLIIKPLALYTVSFQLSFSAVLAIAMIYPRLLNIFDASLNTSAAVRLYILTAFLVSVAATVGCLPFMLYHFNRFSPIGPFMNILVEPFLCFWALPLGLLAIPFMFIAPGPAEVLLGVGSIGITSADKITAWAGALPISSFWTITPSPVQVGIYFLLLGLLFWRRPSRKTIRAALTGFIVLGLWFTSGLWLHLPGTRTEVSFLDVGQGSATFIRLPGGETILIDGGTRTASGYDVGQSVIAPFLWLKQCWNLDDVIITHPDSDHYNGLPYIIRRFRPKRLWINGDGKDIPPYQHLLKLSENLGTRLLKPQTGQSIPHRGNVRISFLTGATQRSRLGAWETGQAENISVNDRSLVVRLEHEEVSFLFPGDLGFQGEKPLLKRKGNLRADVLLAAHHGSSGSNSKPFVTAVNPQIIIVSSGRNVRGLYFDRDHRKKWENAGRKVLATALNGTATCTTNGQQINVRTFTR